MITYQHAISKILSRTCGTKFFLILSLASISCLTSCDESSVVGLDVQPSNDLLNVEFQDTTTIWTITQSFNDTIRTDEDFQIGATAMIGKYIDPVFGKTFASLYTQLGLSAGISDGDFGVNPICDSVILSLVYDSVSANTYGKKLRAQQKINVYKLDDNSPIVRGSTYYAYSTLPYDQSFDLANGYTFTPKTKNMVTIWASDTVVSKPVLRVPLNTALFGQLLLNNQSTGDLASTSVFQANLLKGLYITTENTTGLSRGEGNILRFRLDESKMIVYYHNNTQTKKRYEFILNGQARFSHFEHDYSNNINPSLSQQLSYDTCYSDVAFIQAMGGVKTKILTPYLMHWIDSGAVSINKAELIIKVSGTAANYATSVKTSTPIIYSSPFETSLYQLDTFSAPGTLTMGGINNDGTSYNLPDLIGGPSSTYFGGDYNSSTKEYRFNIARYIQQVLDGTKPNNGLYLIIPSLTANAFATRIAIGGGAPGPYQMKLNITYTKLH